MSGISLPLWRSITLANFNGTILSGYGFLANYSTTLSGFLNTAIL